MSFSSRILHPTLGSEFVFAKRVGIINKGKVLSVQSLRNGYL